MKNCLPTTGLLDVDKSFSMLVRMLHNEHYHRYTLYIMLSPFPLEKDMLGFPSRIYVSVM